MSESGAMLPLTVPQVEPWVRSPQSRLCVVEATWDKLEEKAEGSHPYRIEAMRAAYVAGVYAASAAVLNERAHARELSEAAGRIEREG